MGFLSLLYTEVHKNMDLKIITYFDKEFEFKPNKVKDNIEEMSFYAVESGKAIVVYPDAGD